MIQNDGRTPAILTSNGCGLLKRGFYLCPTIAITIALCENHGIYVQPDFLGNRVLFYIQSTWLDSENPFLQKMLDSDGNLQSIVKLSVKYLLSEAESQWLNSFPMPQNGI